MQSKSNVIKAKWIKSVKHIFYLFHLSKYTTYGQKQNSVLPIAGV